MLRRSKYILFAGIVLGTVSGLFFTYVGWNLHPMVFDMDPEYSLLIFLSWFAVVLLPFILITGGLELHKFLKEKPRKK